MPAENQKERLKYSFPGLMILLLFFSFPLSAQVLTGGLMITCPDSLLPVYVDNVFVGVTPLNAVIVVSEGWHTVGFFQDSDIPKKTPVQSLEYTKKKLISGGIQKIYVAQDEIVEVFLSPVQISSSITRSAHKGRNILLIFLSIFLISIILIPITGLS